MARIDHTIQLLLGGNKGSSLPISEVEKLYEILKSDNHADVNIKSEFKRFGINPVVINKVVPQQVSQRLQNISQATKQSNIIQPIVANKIQQQNTVQIPQRIVQKIDADISKLGLPKTIEYIATVNKYTPEQKLAIINEAITKRGFQPYTNLNDVDSRNLIRLKQTSQPIVQNTVQQPKPNVVQSVQATQQQTNANAEKLKAWRNTPKYSGVTSATAKPFKPISIRSVPVSNVAANATVNTTVDKVAGNSVNAAKSSMLSRIGNSKLTSPALLAASIGSEFIPGANDPIPEGTTARSIQDALSKIRTATGVAATAGMVASMAAPNPWTLGGTAIASGLSAVSGIGENLMGSFYGEKPAEQVVSDISGVDTSPVGSLHGESDPTEFGYGTQSGNEMSYQDIFDNLAQNKINYETPVSSEVLNKAIKNTVFSSIGEMMGQNTSGGIRGDVVFNNTYNKQLNALLNIRDTLNNAEVGSDQYRLAGIASNAMLYGQDTLNAIDSNFNKDLARVNSIMKTYSKSGNNDAIIQKYDKAIADLEAKRSVEISKVEALIADNAQKSADSKKIRKFSQQEQEYMIAKAGAQLDAPILELKQKRDYILANGERRVGSSTTMTAKGKAIVDMWNSLPSKNVDITDDHVEYIASKAKLNDVQKKALEATIIAESGGRSSSINESDGDSASVGIIQWNGQRANDLIKSAMEQKANPKDAWFQAKHIASDLRNPSSWSSTEAMNKFFATNDQREANKLLTEKYIRPADSTSRVQILKYYQTQL